MSILKLELETGNQNFLKMNKVIQVNLFRQNGGHNAQYFK